ncbi:glycosyl hydrolase family 28-related protein [Brevibacillus daliensis]|uniref:glycosyl hydrolase family 28-related protein n=1 Tax=Brevibacillus daliensis TaxID=2892995 RepID=UPI001E4D18FE|nr:glycosyl hydrolase family 28-related protein [Brevibacillus daliensis]
MALKKNIKKLMKSLETNVEKVFANAKQKLNNANQSMNHSQPDTTSPSEKKLTAVQEVGSTAQMAEVTIEGKALADLSVNAIAIGLVGDGISDDTAALKSALNLVSAKGGTVILPVGIFRITSTIVLPPKCTLQGAGYSSEYVTPSAPTVIKKDGNFVGISLSDDSVLLGLQVYGHTGNGKDGIQVIGSRVLIKNVSSTSHQGIGIRIGTDIGNNCNLWRLENVFCLGNTGSGIYVHDSAISPNVNAGLLLGADIRSNKGHGLVIENAIDCTFIGVACQQNVQKGIYLKKGAKGHQFYGAYVEDNQTGEFILDPGADRNHVMWFRSGIISSNIENNGAGNFIVDRDSQDYDRPFASSGLNINKLGITDPAISGVWRLQQNPINRDLQIVLENTSATPVFVRLTHTDASKGAEVGLSLQRLEINGGQALRDFRNRQAIIDLPNMAKQTTNDYVITVNGAKTGDTAVANPVRVPPAGIIWSCFVSADNQVTIRFYNTTQSTVNPSPQTWRISTWRADAQ